MTAQSPQGMTSTVVSGIGFAAVAYFLFSMQDATTKWLVAGFPVPQILFMRSLVIVPFCLAFAGPRVAVRAAVSPVRLQLAWRALVLIGAWACYFTAARELQLAELVTIYFSSPLLVAALAIPLLKERLTWPRWLSLAIGFAGVVIACRPGELGRDLGQALPIALALAASAMWAYTTILIRQVVHAETTAVQMLISNVTFLVVCGALMPWYWQAPTGTQLALMLLVGGFGAAGQFMSTEGIRRAPATVVAPISFSSLLWSFCLGLAIWGDLPSPAVFLGAGLILLSGLLVAGAEWRSLRRLRRTIA
jgi:drug/metabolite transporter (DMT)-like permease